MSPKSATSVPRVDRPDVVVYWFNTALATVVHATALGFYRSPDVATPLLGVAVGFWTVLALQTLFYSQKVSEPRPWNEYVQFLNGWVSPCAHPMRLLSGRIPRMVIASGLQIAAGVLGVWPFSADSHIFHKLSIGVFGLGLGSVALLLMGLGCRRVCLGPADRSQSFSTPLSPATAQAPV